MLNVRVIAVGTLKEQYLRDACGEYLKRLRSFCRPEIIEIRESRLSDSPAAAEINNALESEGGRILAAIPPRACAVALCVEGTAMPSEELAVRLSGAETLSDGCLCIVIGGSYGLSERVKSACALRLSFSELTFPHQLMRVMLLEQLYRCFMINSGRRYHK